MLNQVLKELKNIDGVTYSLFQLPETNDERKNTYKYFKKNFICS